MRTLGALRVAGTLLLPALCLAEPAMVIRATELKRAPATDAESAGQLAENAKVEALERRGLRWWRGR